MKLQRLGGYAAIAFVLVVVAYGLLQSQMAKHTGGGITDPTKFRDLVSTAPAGFYAAAILLMILFSLLLIMFFALYERMQTKAPQLTLISLIASSAGTVIMVAFGIFYFAYIRLALQHGFPEKIVEVSWTFFANGDEFMMAASHFYGWACLLMGCAILRVRPFSALLGWLFVIVGFLNILGFVHFFFNAAGHLCLFVAAVWAGIAMLRQKLPQTVMEEMAVLK